MYYNVGLSNNFYLSNIGRLLTSVHVPYQFFYNELTQQRWPKTIQQLTLLTRYMLFYFKSGLTRLIFRFRNQFIAIKCLPRIVDKKIEFYEPREFEKQNFVKEFYQFIALCCSSSMTQCDQIWQNFAT